jgi:hypothetical protein
MCPRFSIRQETGGLNDTTEDPTIIIQALNSHAKQAPTEPEWPAHEYLHRWQFQLRYDARLESGTGVIRLHGQLLLLLSAAERAPSFMTT